MCRGIRNIDVNENPGGDMILPWSGTTPSYWQVVGEETRGDITMDFLEVDREKAKLGVFEYTVKLPDGAPGDPKGLATSGKTIKLSMKLRSYKFGVAGEGLYPVIYAGLNTDYASSSAAYTVIHELAHALDFAPKTGEFHYSMAGAHCCYGIKSDVEAYVRDNGGTLGATINATINIKPNGKNIPVELVTQGKFGKCVMWGQTHRQKTTEALFAAAIKFCGTCAPLMRVTPIGAKCGGEV